jgi:DNA-binding XRE family transcriptional regulator
MRSALPGPRSTASGLHSSKPKPNGKHSQFVVLKQRREEKGMTQAALAEKVGVGQTYIAKLESGDKKNPTLDLLKKLAKALGVPVTELLGGG